MSTDTTLSTQLHIRAKIEALESQLKNLIASEQMQEETGTLQHYFIPGVYAREAARPAGTIVVGKLHKFPRLLMLSKGTITYTTETEHKRVQAPYTVVLAPGSKIATLAHTDAVLTTIHKTDEIDLDAIEAELIASTREEYECFCLEQAEQQLKLQAQEIQS